MIHSETEFKKLYNTALRVTSLSELYPVTTLRLSRKLPSMPVLFLRKRPTWNSLAWMLPTSSKDLDPSRYLDKITTN